ncbi:putative maltose permease [Venturia nashicola]|uniref:Putative maltose permease n=1 Tax=Venturia nashicola TaxID=86259 RepID=A0A4Z1PAJ5_9PEZI|nr:putative maltose permease [Venturia nashicola]
MVGNKITPTEIQEEVIVASVSANNAQAATDAEHNMTPWQALKTYPTAAAWSVFFSLGTIMTAFDPQLLGNLYATPAFQRDFGYKYQGNFIISAPWQTGLGMGNPVGQVLGAFACAYPLDRYGRKKTFASCVALTGAFIFIQVFAKTLPVLLVGEILGGLVLGTFPVIAPTYASEVCPVALRGILTAYVNLSFVTGQLIANGVIAGTSKLSDHWAYSGPFAAQWFWVLAILIGLPFAPESPWWLARKGRLDEAEHSLRRLASSNVDVKPTLAMIVETDRLEHELEMGFKYSDCFKKINVRRTEIAVGVYVIQNLSGIYMLGYTTLFFQLAGLSVTMSFNMSVAFLAVGFVGVLFSWFLLAKFGRRIIYNSGLSIMAIIMLVVGIVDCLPNYINRPGLAWTQVALFLLWNFCFDFSIGPVCYVLISEISATTVRAKTIAVATAVQAVVGILMSVAIPYIINPDQANLRGKICFLFGGLSVISLIWSWLRVPETKGRTYEELDIMFARKIRTRDFSKYRIE